MWHHIPNSLKDFCRDNEHLTTSIEAVLSTEGEWQGIITPRRELVLSAYYHVSLDPYGFLPNSLRVVMLFQDVYPKAGDACGIATACLHGGIPDTLCNIYTRLKEIYPPFAAKWSEGVPDGDIRGWASQGVLLTNVALTCRISAPKSHIPTWTSFTSRMIQWLSDTHPFLVFVLFGAEAKDMERYINKGRHAILKTSHPSNLGKIHGFDTCNIFNEVNDALTKAHRDPIRWEDIEYV